MQDDNKAFWCSKWINPKDTVNSYPIVYVVPSCKVATCKDIKEVNSSAGCDQNEIDKSERQIFSRVKIDSSFTRMIKPWVSKDATDSNLQSWNKAPPPTVDDTVKRELSVVHSSDDELHLVSN